jgi:hypothetical protein
MEARLQVEVQKAIARLVTPPLSPNEAPHVIRSVGMVVAALAVQSNVSRSDFCAAMGDYHDGVSKAIGLTIEPEQDGPTLILP